MSYIKYMACVVLMLIGVWASLELYQIHLLDFGEFVTIQAYTEEAENVEEYIDTLVAEAKNLSVDVVFVNNKMDKDGNEDITIHCEESFRETLQNDCWYYEGTQKGMLSGTTTVVYKSLPEIDTKKFSRAEYSCKLYGEDEDVGAFLHYWKEDGGKIVSGKGVVKNTVRLCLVMLWAIVVCVIGSMTVFERMLGRKEFFVRLSVGESLFRSSVIHIVSDVVVYFAAAGIAVLVVRRLSGAVWFSGYAWGTAGVLSVISTMLYLSLLRNSFRYAFSNAMMSEDTLLFGHFLLACFIAALLVLVPFISSSYRDYSNAALQRDLFSRFKGYYYVQFSPYVSDVLGATQGEGGTSLDPFYHSDEVSRKFYEENFLKYSPSFFGKYMVVSDVNICYANVHMKSYLEELFQMTIPDGYDAVCFYPKKLRQELLKQWGLERFLYSYDGETTIRWIPYEHEISTGVTETLQNDFAVMRNPVVVYESISAFEEGDWKTKADTVYKGFLYCKCSEEEILAFAEEHGVAAYYEDVYEGFREYYSKAKNAFWSMTVIATLLSGMVIFFYMTILRLECLINGMELAIKKTLGIPLIDRMFKLYVMAVGFSLLGMLLSVALLQRMQRDFEPMSVLVGGGLLLIQVILITGVGKKLEKQSVQKVLKNG